MARQLSKIAYTIAFLICWAFFFTLTHVPLELGTAPGFLNIPFADKLVHFGLYFWLAIFSALVLNQWFGKAGNQSPRFVILIIAVLFCGTYGMIDEVTQIWVPMRGADPLDWCSDMAGAIVGGTSLWAIWMWKRGEKAEAESSS